jgi:XapX domain-containing protein
MTYLVSLLVGVAVGVAYALIGVRSPAPPLVALFGLLGIVAGEQGVPWVKGLIAERHATAVSSPAPLRHGGSRQEIASGDPAS